MNVMTVNVWPYPGRPGEFCGATDLAKPRAKGAYISFISCSSPEKIHRRAEQYAGGPVELVLHAAEPVAERMDHAALAREAG